MIRKVLATLFAAAALSSGAFAQHSFMSTSSAPDALFYFENSDRYAAARMDGSTSALLPLRIDQWGASFATYRIAIDKADPLVGWAGMPATSWQESTTTGMSGCYQTGVWAIETRPDKTSAALLVRSLDRAQRPFAYILPTLAPTAAYVVAYPRVLCWASTSQP